MFTGIIQATAKVLRSSEASGKLLLTIQRPTSFSDLALGASIACDGICLTVIKFDSQSFSVEVMRETAQKTTAAAWKTNTVLNLERALKLGDRLDGHWVQGHIDRTAKLLETKVKGSTRYLRLMLEPQDAHLVVPQGSIAINGVSLTIADLSASSFSVALIGHTLENSNLGRLTTGSAVNLEFDILGKYIRTLHQNTDLSRENLYEQGF